MALARVLVTRPRILLLDEPLSALDKNLREEMKYWIKDLQRSLGITTIYVTHDQSEALTMSDRIGVMNKSRVVQVGTPTEIYERPADLFVTTFIGESNLLDGTVRRATRRRGRTRARRRQPRSQRRRAKGLAAGPAGQTGDPAGERPARRRRGRRLGASAGSRRREDLPGRADPLPAERRPANRSSPKCRTRSAVRSTKRAAA